LIARSIIDTGAFVALLREDDRNHGWATEAFKAVPEVGMVTCEAVITEAAFMLGRWLPALDEIFGRLATGILKLVPMDGDSGAVHAFMTRYRNVPASYADACLVRLSERFPEAPVVTTDADFQIYRRNGKQRLPLIAPFA
jgi:predicted nucleic acid-binding protein